MDVFRLRDRLIEDYSDFVRGFIHILDTRISQKVDEELDTGLLWPDPLIQLNPSFQPGETIDELVNEGLLHELCSGVFRKGKSEAGIDRGGVSLRLHKHQADAVKIASKGHNYVLTTGTGSGKSLAYIIPIVNHILRSETGQGIQAIVVYPMNALANSQEGELKKFLCHGFPDGRGPVSFARYTGQESDEQKQEIISNPPDILLTNYVMLELLLTRNQEKPLIEGGKNLRFLVLDELHTYRGRQGADVSMLVRRTKDAFASETIQCVGTSATLSSSGTYADQMDDVADVASTIFGDKVYPEHVIVETLRRATKEQRDDDPIFLDRLRNRLESDVKPPQDYNGYINDPLSSWIETIFGIAHEPESGRLVRAKPISITGDKGAAKILSELTGVPENRCIKIIQEQLLASYGGEPNPDTGFPVFAFRLHQFISRGDTIYASLESEKKRHLTFQAQQFVPGDRSKILLPLVFCRECGQEYYCVRKERDQTTHVAIYAPRELSDRLKDENDEPGFLFNSSTDPWPEDLNDIIERLPDDWVEEHRGVRRVKSTRKKNLPESIRLTTKGREGETGIDMQYLTAPFRFCLKCGVAYNFRQTSDFGKLASLGTEGRSTATTILSLASTRYLQKDESLAPRARKLLSFTDNRQDASLQAGHFNDFVEIGLLRSALHMAVDAAGTSGLTHDNLVQNVFNALDLPKTLYAADPDVRFRALEETEKALRQVIGYRLYRDLKRGWRITAPNLEQCGLLIINYLSLDDVCKAQDVWEGCHPVLQNADPEVRKSVAKTILDFMRRELAIKVAYLEAETHERIKLQSSQRLRVPWAIDESERMETSSILYPRPMRKGQDYSGNVFLSPRGGFGQYLGRPNTFGQNQPLSLIDKKEICQNLLEALRIAGLTEVVSQPRDPDDVPGYQLPAAGLVWLPGDASTPFHDPIRVPGISETGGRTNPFFIRYYEQIANDGKGMEAREHTAQVRYEDRIDREERFRDGHLPILYCSPTMELGVDIAELNCVNMRNIPPTPANYAQRSGRAGRSGQPALVFSYCSTFRPHDQYFFKRPHLMVAGSVTPPRLDLANEDLIKAHVHAIWLAEAGIHLGTSLKDVLDLSGENPNLELQNHAKDSIGALSPRERADHRAKKVLSDVEDCLKETDWYSDQWISEVINQVGTEFERACERWRGLYRAADRQQRAMNRIANDHHKSHDEKEKAKRLRAEAEAQLDLLTELQNVVVSDFYSYRYFASEGFLPGYNFPRLPLSAFIPGRRRQRGVDEFLSRPRFLAIAEFGPRAIVYHEGSRFRINKVILPVEDRGEGDELVTNSAKQCESCGYLHPIHSGDGPDLCERCGLPLPIPLRNLFRLQNVATKRVERINSDEEERLRLGYEVKTGIRFSRKSGGPSYKTASIQDEEDTIATLIYGQASTLWRINLGWTRRAQKDQHGFVLDTERGYWATNQQDADDAEDPMSQRKVRVVPFVEDTKNALLLEPEGNWDDTVMASLQAALKNAIQVEFQLEDSELAAEPLPGRDTRRCLLFYEAAEGGAGVLRLLLEDSTAFNRVAKQALSLCHFDPDTGQDLKRPPEGKEDCEAACYDCLLSYFNQPDHAILDRKAIRDLLLKFRDANVNLSPVAPPRAVHFERLRNQCQSALEKSWLQFLEDAGYNLPSRAQVYFEECSTRPDFLYEDKMVAIYVDGPHHEYPERKERDAQQMDCLADILTYQVIRFGHQDDWEQIVDSHPYIFGRKL